MAERSFFRASDFEQEPGAVHHFAITQTGVKHRLYVNGWRQRRPAWLWTRLNRMRARRFNRNAYG